MLHRIRTSDCRITACSLLFVLFFLAPVTLTVAAPAMPEDCATENPPCSSGGENLPWEMFVGLQSLPQYAAFTVS